MLEHLSWTTTIGIGAMVFSTMLLFVYLYMLRTFEDEKKLQKARRQLLNLPEETGGKETVTAAKNGSKNGVKIGTGSQPSQSRLDAMIARKKELGLIGSAGTGTLRNRKGKPIAGNGAGAGLVGDDVGLDGADYSNEESDELKLHRMIENLDLDNAKESIQEIDKAVEECMEGVRAKQRTQSPGVASSVERLYEKYQLLVKELNLAEDKPEKCPTELTSSQLEWRGNKKVKEGEKELKRAAGDLFTRLQHNCKNGVDVLPALRELLGMLRDISESGEPMAAIVTKQILFCNELMARDSLTVLQELKSSNDKTTGKLAEQLLEKVVPLIWSS